MNINQIEKDSFLVGGAVRDAILGIDCNDRDYVVVGHTTEEMIAAGFLQVGNDFPVFIHPTTGEEYALARKEKSTGDGYNDFVFNLDATLEDDLGRRDLTINSMAMDSVGNVIDPFNGVGDLKQGFIRHTSDAFDEDPVRILRAIRFRAQYNFVFHPSTICKIVEMVNRGDIDHLTQERVWKELSKCLMTEKPSIAFTDMYNLGILEKIFPELHALCGVPQTPKYHPEIDTFLHTMMAIDYAAKDKLGLSQRFGVLCHDLGKGTTPKDLLPKHHGHEIRGVPIVEAVCDRLRVDRECKQLAMSFCKNHTRFFQLSVLNPGSVIKIFEDIGAYRNPKMLWDQLDMAVCDKRGRGGEYPSYPVDFRAQFLYLFDVSETIDKKAIAEKFSDGQKIKAMIHNERASVIRQSLSTYQQTK